MRAASQLQGDGSYASVLRRIAHWFDVGGGNIDLFGCKKDGQCNPPNLTGIKVVQISCGGRHTGIVTEDYKISIFGSNNENQCNSKY